MKSPRCYETRTALERLDKAIALLRTVKLPVDDPNVPKLIDVLAHATHSRENLAEFMDAK